MECPSEQTQLSLVIFGTIVFFMQAGFCCLEAGSVRERSVINIMFKNLNDIIIGALAWFICGYAFAFGDGANHNWFIGLRGFFLTNTPRCDYPFYFFQWTFSAAATTIVSGAMAERTKIAAFSIYSFVIPAFIYAFIVHWTWSSEAWLPSDDPDKIHFQDFAGSGVVHVTGGTIALVGTALLGPRRGRFIRNGNKLVPSKTSHLGHSVPLVGLGTFILFFGFLAFNGGSALTYPSTNSSAKIAQAMISTVLSGTGAGLSSSLFERIQAARQHQKATWRFITTNNGLLAGMVAICASAANVEPWASLVIGIVAGVVYQFWSGLMLRHAIDDPVDAVAVHLGPGIWGLMAAPLFQHEHGVFYTWDADAFRALAWNIAGCLTIIMWSLAWAGLMFAILHHQKLLRIEEQVELMGIDEAVHNGFAYFLKASRRNANAAQLPSPDIAEPTVEESV